MIVFVNITVILTSDTVTYLLSYTCMCGGMEKPSKNCHIFTFATIYSSSKNNRMKCVSFLRLYQAHFSLFSDIIEKGRICI